MENDKLRAMFEKDYEPFKGMQDVTAKTIEDIAYTMYLQGFMSAIADAELIEHSII